MALSRVPPSGLALVAVMLLTFSFSAGATGHNLRQVTDAPKESSALHAVTSDHKSIDDWIEALPGQPPVTFEQRSGYIAVGGGRSLFYYYVEAASSPESAPLTLWLNGGPGCSSLGNGGLSELGPFFPNKDGNSLQANPHSWNLVSNIVFLESPAGVGFSFFTDPSDNTVGDERTALDAWAFLVGFLKKYPALAAKPLFIAGESYAGHYVPQLADTILRKNSEEGSFKINLEAMAVGNAWTDAGIDNRGAADFWWSHALVSDESYAGIVAFCNFSGVGPLRSANQDLCDYHVFNAFTEMGLGDISIYDIYSDVCLGYERYVRHFARQLNRTLMGGLSTRPLLYKAATTQDACIDDEVERYLNRPEVQRALHVRRPASWQGCSDTLDYSRRDLLTSVLPLYPRLLHSGLRILVYSGDVDAIVPVTGTRDWLRQLKLPVKKTWRPWLHADQVGGYVTEYENLTFVTVREAGHMVPYTQPGRALQLFTSFVTDTPL